MADVAKILCWDGGWGLPSIDPACLQVLAYARFAGFPMKMLPCNNPYKSPTGTFPVLYVPDDIICECDEILAHIQCSEYNPDKDLSEKQKIETSALCCYVEDMLRPAFLYMLWLNDTNYTQFVRGWYARQLKFPYNYVIPGSYVKHNCNFIAHKLNIDENEVVCEETEEKLNKRAKKCFETLSTLLSNQEYIFGESPTTLDSKIFAYLSIILKVPVPKNKLKCDLLSFPKLEQYCDRVVHLYFSEISQRQAPLSSISEIDNDDSKSSKLNAFLSVGFAVLAMVFYAFSSGLVSIEVSHYDKHLNNNEDDVE